MSFFSGLWWALTTLLATLRDWREVIWCAIVTAVCRLADLLAGEWISRITALLELIPRASELPDGFPAVACFFGVVDHYLPLSESMGLAAVYWQIAGGVVIVKFVARLLPWGR